MSNNINAWVLLGAAVVGLVSAAGVFLIEQFRQDKKKHAHTQDLIRLDDQLSSLRQELEVLRKLQKERNSAQSKSSRRKSRNSSALSVTSTEDYTSALGDDSSDLEFYDLSSDEDNSTVETSLEKDFEVIDLLLEDESEYREVLDKLETLNKRHPDNPDILWRLGKAIRIKIILTSVVEERKELINRGVEICEHAVDLAPTSASCHKWLAILIGLRGECQPTKERILDGHLFADHIREALKYTPNDPTLHHLLGRFTFEIAKLTWLEKAVASTLFAELPTCSYEDAIDCFLQAEKLNVQEWKENRLFIAKCQLAIGNTDAGVEWLTKAQNATNSEEEKVHEEVRSLLEKYKK